MYILITLLDVPRIQLLQNIWEVVEMRIYLFQWLWLPTMNPIQVWHQFTHFGDDDFGEARTLNGLGVGVHATEEYPLGCATWTPQRKVSGRLPWRRGVDSAQEKRVPINLLGDMCIRAGSPRGTLQLIDQNRQIRVSSRLIWFAYCRIARIDWCGRAGVGRAWTGDRRGVHGQGGGGGGCRAALGEVRACERWPSEAPRRSAQDRSVVRRSAAGDGHSVSSAGPALAGAPPPVMSTPSISHLCIVLVFHPRRRTRTRAQALSTSVYAAHPGGLTVMPAEPGQVRPPAIRHWSPRHVIWWSSWPVTPSPDLMHYANSLQTAAAIPRTAFSGCSFFALVLGVNTDLKLCHLKVSCWATSTGT